MHNIFLMVGPSHCGKSVLANRLQKEVGGVILSSDDIRRELLGDPSVDKMDPRMMTVSKQAFDLLFSKLEAHTSYPINTPNIFLDTTGLDEGFRNKVCVLAKKNRYAVHALCFIFDNKEEYFTYCDTPFQKSVTRKHVDKLFKTQAGKLPSKNFTSKHVLRSREKAELFTWEQESEACHLEVDNANYIVVGDVHGCYEELVELIEKNKGQQASRFIFVGDIIDKGDKVEECVDLVLSLIREGRAHCVRGNHENFALKYWQGQASVEQSVLEEHFTSALVTNEGFRKKVKELWCESYDWVSGPGFIVTHSPCEKIYLGKHDKSSIKAQRNLRHVGKDVPQLLSFLTDRENDHACYPLHIFGHVALDKVYRGRSWCALDTGCVYGNKLSYIDLTNRYIGEIAAKEWREKKEVSKLEKEPELRISDLDSPRDRGRAHSLIENKVNFLSGTMSPADKLGGDLESLQWALDYYRSQGQTHLVLQKKMMGSRCQIYLFNDPSLCYAVSRNGYLVGDRLDMIPIYKKLIERFKEEFEQDGLQMRILDGELMPWSALGRGLIDKSFYGYYEVVKNNFDALRETGFYEIIKKTKGNLSPDFGILTKKEFIDKHKHHILKMHEGYHKVSRELVDEKEMEDGLIIFHENIDRYGQDDELSYFPFYILKDVYSDKEKVYGSGTSTYEAFLKVNSGGDVDQVKIRSDDIQSAQEIFTEWSYKEGNEGIVVKPAIMDDKAAPYLKVRNIEYLTITYGPDYRSPNKMAKLLRKKSITRKLRASIEDWQLGQKMLSVPYSELESSKPFESYVVQSIGGEQKDLDPRL